MQIYVHSYWLKFRKVKQYPTAKSSLKKISRYIHTLFREISFFCWLQIIVRPYNIACRNNCTESVRDLICYKKSRKISESYMM